MPHNPITLDLLKVLDAIDQRGSFAAAAQALHKVPSALTYTIQKVEQDLGLKLFDRSGHRAKLTAAGNLLGAIASGNASPNSCSAIYCIKVSKPSSIHPH